MPQNVLFNLTQSPSTSALRASDVSINTFLNVTATTVIKASAGVVHRLIIQTTAPGSGATNWSLNDCATTGAITTANQVWSMSTTNAGTLTTSAAAGVVVLDFPFKTGIAIQTPGAGSPVAVVSYD